MMRLKAVKNSIPNMKILTVLFLFLSMSFGLSAQEIIVPAATHQELRDAIKNGLSGSTPKSGGVRTLPFVDDFSYPGIYPADSLWANRTAFVNNRYAINPPSIGVATLDAVNDSGGHYPLAGSGAFGADTLLSLPIRLDSVPALNLKLSPSDSVFFSFFYQPQGIGNAPEEDDSLVLEFFAPNQQKWIHIWATEGMSFVNFFSLYNTYFRYILIPLTDTAFFHEEFRFRFTNYASLATLSLPSFTGNVDHWHLDYVYLDYNRSVSDTAMNDVAIVSGPSTLIKGYHSLPWTQYLADTTNYMMHDIRFGYSKYAGVTEIIDLSFRITDLTGTTGNYTASPAVFNYGNSVAFTDTAIIPRPDFQNYFFRTNQTNNGMVDFEVLAWLKPNLSKNISVSNDTFRLYQRFYNYIAYDDGTAEAGYGLAPSGARLAYRYTLNHPDTLRSIMMYFNQTLNNASQKYFYLTVWNDNNGKPGTVIYEKSGKRPEYEYELNRFHVYDLTEPVAVSGTFYIGWRQTTDDNLNVGFDRNTDNKDHIFYNVDGNWLTSLHSGSLMIRPVLGSTSAPFADIEKNPLQEARFRIFPNPLHEDVLQIQTYGLDEGDYKLVISDMAGRQIRITNLAPELDLGELGTGVYLISLIHSGQRIGTPLKLIKY